MCKLYSILAVQHHINKQNWLKNDGTGQKWLLRGKWRGAKAERCLKDVWCHGVTSRDEDRVMLGSSADPTNQARAWNVALINRKKNPYLQSNWCKKSRKSRNAAGGKQRGRPWSQRSFVKWSFVPMMAALRLPVGIITVESEQIKLMTVVWNWLATAELYCP